MIKKISKEIKKVAKDNNIFIDELSVEQIIELKNNIMKKYICNYKCGFLWEHLKTPSIISDNEGWKKICDFIGNKKCVMFFEIDEDKSMLVINNGQILYKILSEMFAFEFYITDFQASFLICFNHHDCLLCCGAAQNWLYRIHKK